MLTLLLFIPLHFLVQTSFHLSPYEVYILAHFFCLFLPPTPAENLLLWITCMNCKSKAQPHLYSAPALRLIWEKASETLEGCPSFSFHTNFLQMD